MSVTQAVWVSFLLTVALAVLHLAAGRIRKLPAVPEAATASFAGGLAVAYVFLHLLPELADGNVSIGAALNDVIAPTPLLDLAIFLVALVGFTAFYGLERLADRTRNREDSARRGVFRLHLGSFVVYNALITYTMPLRVRTGLMFAVLFTIAMAMHFVLTDRALDEDYGALFDTRAKILLGCALVIGWFAAAVLAPTSVLVVSLLTALLAGSILWNVFKNEVPSSSGSSYGWFVTGLTTYAALLAGVTVLAG